MRSPMQSDRASLSLHEASAGDLSIVIEVPIRRLNSFMAANDIAATALLKTDVEGTSCKF